MCKSELGRLRLLLMMLLLLLLFLHVSVEQCQIDPSVFVAFLKLKLIARMEQGRIENNRPVFSKGHRDISKVRRSKKMFVHEIGVAVVAFKVPIVRWLHRVNDQSSAVGVQVCLVWGQPYVDIHGCLVGVQVDSSVVRIVCL